MVGVSPVETLLYELKHPSKVCPLFLEAISGVIHEKIIFNLCVVNLIGSWT